MGETDWRQRKATPRLPRLVTAAALGIAFYMLLVPVVTHATADSDFHQRIVPLECVIEEINDGVSETYFLSPEECENKLNPPIEVPDNKQPASDTNQAIPSSDSGQLFSGTPFEGGFEQQTQAPVKEPDVEIGSVSLLPASVWSNKYLIIALIISFPAVILYAFSNPVKSIWTRLGQTLRRLV